MKVYKSGFDPNEPVYFAGCDKYDEELIKAAAERAALRELLEDERMLMNDASIKTAALKVDDEFDNPEGE